MASDHLFIGLFTPVTLYLVTGEISTKLWAIASTFIGTMRNLPTLNKMT